MYPIFLCLFLRGTRILWFREVNRLARGAQLSERQAHLKPRLFAPHSTPGQDGDHEVSGSPQRRSPQGTPLTLALRGRPRVASLTPTNRLTLCRWPVSPARLRSRGGAGRGGAGRSSGEAGRRGGASGRRGGAAARRRKEVPAGPLPGQRWLRLRPAAPWDRCRGLSSCSTMCCPPIPGWPSR